jgi:hypothetical protein
MNTQNYIAISNNENNNISNDNDNNNISNNKNNNISESNISQKSTFNSELDVLQKSTFNSESFISNSYVLKSNKSNDEFTFDLPIKKYDKFTIEKTPNQTENDDEFTIETDDISELLNMTDDIISHFKLEICIDELQLEETEIDILEK